MWLILAHIVIGFRLMVHGFAPRQIPTGWETKDARSPPLDRLGLAPASIVLVGDVLWVTALIAFNVAGFADFANLT
jgi:hypothetical protein